MLSALCFHGSNNPLGGRYCCSHFTDEKTETFKSSVIYPWLCAPVKVTDGRQKTEESDSQKEEWRWAESEVERERCEAREVTGQRAGGGQDREDERK